MAWETADLVFTVLYPPPSILASFAARLASKANKRHPSETARKTDQRKPTTVNAQARCTIPPPPFITHFCTRICPTGTNTHSARDNPNPASAQPAARDPSFHRPIINMHPTKLTSRIGNCPANMVSNVMS